MQRLGGIVQNYAWGSKTALADLTGRDATGQPEAELWLGAHPSASSTIETADGTVALNAWIAANATSALGPCAHSDFGRQLPFLLKVLAAGEPLSLQAHPSSVEAKRGFAEENAAGVPIDAPHRSYRDPFHKPELICALTPFTALCGFRRPDASNGLLEGLGVAELAPVVTCLASGSPTGVREALGMLLQAPADVAEPLATKVAAACRADKGPAEFARERRWGALLAEKYPGDPGVVTALLLNLVELEPGEALFLGAGNLHAYLGGVGIEIMAASDNVLRGGLTPKYVDVDALLAVVDPSPFPVDVQRPPPLAGITTYESPVQEFRLQHILVGRPRPLQVCGPEIVLCIEGTVELRAESGSGETQLRLDRGEAVFIPFDTRSYRLSGDGAVYRATTGTPVP